MTRAAAGPLLVPLLALTGTVLLAWGAALARPRPDSEAQPARPGVHAVLLDVSGSAVRGRRGHLRWCNQVLLREARRASAAARDLCVVQVAAGARIAFGPADPALLVARLEGRGEPFVPGFEEADQHRSRIDDGVAVLQAVMAETGRAAGTLVLVVDDTRTGPDPNPRLWSLAREGHGVELTPLPPADRSDLALVEVRLPREVEADAPSAARLELRATALPDGASASLEVTVTGPGGATTHAQPLSCPRDGTFSVHLPLPARGVGEHLVSLRARLDGDVVPENDRLTGNLRVGDARVVLVCARDPHHEALRAWAGAIPGLQLEFATPAGLATRLHRADALLTVDLGPSDLPESITDWVRAGGGWLGCFGWSSFGSWSPPGEGGLSDLCALTPKPGDGEARDVMLLVDGSGSMDGEPFERVKRAVFELVTAALPSDSIELRFFTDQVYGVAFRSSGQSLAERRAELAPLLNARVPRGGTDIGESLIVFAGTRLGVERRGLVLLLTDGIGTTRRATEVRGRLSAAGLDLRILQVGDDPKGRQFLEGMLLEGEEVIAAGNLSDLGRLLQHEVNRERVREDPGMRAVLAAPSGALGAELLPGWSPAGFGEPLVRYARAEVVGAAEVLWASSREAEPLLAVQRVGEGLVATLAGLPGAFPADAWAPFAGPDTLAPLLHGLARGRVNSGPRLVDGLDGEGLAGLRLENVPLDWPDPLRLELHLPPREGLVGELVWGPVLETHSLHLAPGAAIDPRSERWADARGRLSGFERGTALVARVTADGTRLATLPVTAAGPAEWVGGGTRWRPDPGLGEVERTSPRAAAAPSRLAPWVIGLGGLAAAAAALAAVLNLGQGNRRTGRR